MKLYTFKRICSALSCTLNRREAHLYNLLVGQCAQLGLRFVAHFIYAKRRRGAEERTTPRGQDRRGMKRSVVYAGLIILLW